jgi:acetoin utilization deacetylase AcuC-like enzyme
MSDGGTDDDRQEPATRFWTHDRCTFPLPEGHRFPIRKYALLRERVEAAGLGEVVSSDPAAWADLALVHTPEYLERVRTGALSIREVRALGLPWSEQLVERGRRSSQGTVEAARDALRDGWGMNLGGGTHHAFAGSGRGFCLFNDVVLAVRVLRRDGALERVLVVDCDVHQGDGTASLCREDPLTYTLSIHGAANYPFRRETSDDDVDLPSGTGDDAYLTALELALRRAFPQARPDLVVFLAGADPWEGDALGRLALTKAVLRARDALVLDHAAAHGVPCCVTLAGGYAPDVRDTVEIAFATATAVAGRAAGPTTLARTGP